MQDERAAERAHNGQKLLVEVLASFILQVDVKSKQSCKKKKKKKRNLLDFAPEQLKMPFSDWSQVKGLGTILCMYVLDLWDWQMTLICSDTSPYRNLLPQFLCKYLFCFTSQDIGHQKDVCYIIGRYIRDVNNLPNLVPSVF